MNGSNYIYNALFIAAILSILLAVVAGIFRYNRLSLAMRTIVIGLIITLLSESICYVIVKNKNYALRYSIYHIYDIIESIFITQYFILIIFGSKKIPTVLNLLFWPIIGVANIVFFQPLGSMNTNMLMVESFVFITFSLYYIYMTLKNDKVYNIFSFSYFWMTLAILVLWSSSFFFWALLHYLFADKWKYRVISMYVQTVIEIFGYLCMAVTLLRYNLVRTNDQN